MPDASPATVSKSVGDLQVVLGSASKWRRQLFASRFRGLDFGTASADIDERAVTAGYADRGAANPERLTLALAHAKADAILPSLPEGGTLLITSDQVVSCKGAVREKPDDADACRGYLRAYREEPLATVTALVVTNTSAEGETKRVEAVDVAKQYFTGMPEDVIEALIAKGDVLYSAGGITVEDPLLAPHLGERVGTLDSSALTFAPFYVSCQFSKRYGLVKLIIWFCSILRPVLLCASSYGTTRRASLSALGEGSASFLNVLHIQLETALMRTTMHQCDTSAGNRIGSKNLYKTHAPDEQLQQGGCLSAAIYLHRI